MDKNRGKSFRTALGFSNQEKLRKFFKFTDINIVNWEKIEASNNRLAEIFEKINAAVSEDIRLSDINSFLKKINSAYQIMRNNHIIERLNNQGREPDDVYYNWMRGYLVCEFFLPAIAKLFDADSEQISLIGEDDLTKIETFSRTATADFELIKEKNEPVRLEVQAGYTGTNDIKLSKILEAKNQYDSKKIESYIIHFDFFKGCVAVINVTNFSKIPLGAYHKAFENTDVLKIKDDWFKWNLMEKLPCLSDIVVSYSPELSASVLQ
ncbi:MAG: hypothetical protein IJ530_02750 [Treponema sp.]|uniref:hypothetical protein n=1 Tax=Treponema sp. TaxID=166 RepID=UPI0025FE324A|nr:hypothetical protein [Treponema sp.]MBQ8678661.1 hypothetical protein [Treponema sp.]